MITQRSEPGFRYGRQKLRVLRRYPHLGGHDARVWDRWLRGQLDKWDWVSYDVLVGEHELEGEIGEESLRRLARALLRPRVDVALCRNGYLDLVEVKPLLSPSSIGQALTYSVLAAQGEPEFRGFFPVVICGEAYSHLVGAAGVLGVGVWLACGHVLASPRGVSGVRD